MLLFFFFAHYIKAVMCTLSVFENNPAYNSSPAASPFINMSHTLYDAAEPDSLSAASVHNLPKPSPLSVDLIYLLNKKNVSMVPSVLCLACIMTLYVGHTALLLEPYSTFTGRNKATVGECIIMNAKAEC